MTWNLQNWIELASKPTETVCFRTVLGGYLMLFACAEAPTTLQQHFEHSFGQGTLEGRAV